MKDHKAIYKIAWFFIVVFVALVIYMGYFTVSKSKSIAIHPYNKRLDHLENEVVRGTIYDASGKVLATTEEDARVYPYGSTYAHAIGYSQRGKYGIEALANVELLYPDYHISSLFQYAFNGTKFQGHDVVTTLDHQLQVAAEEGLGKRKGAVVVLEPTTGKIRAMYANPSFDPNTIKEQWDELSDDTTRSPLLNRATHGMYPPASVFKIMTTIAYLEGHQPDFTYTCTGKIEKNGHVIQCYNGTAHGEVDLNSAFTKSCNAYFIALSDKVKPEEVQRVSERLLFNAPLSDKLQHKASSIALKDVSSFDTLAAYIGQGKTLVSPLHMAMVAGMIYNDGVLMAPYLVDYSMDEKGNTRYKQLPEYKGAYIDETICKTLQEMMVQVVEEGTASRIIHEGIRLGGKTGTAQNETGKDHSWFVGFAEDEEKTPIAFAILVEQGGKGAKALDVADKLIHAYFD